MHKCHPLPVQTQSIANGLQPHIATIYKLSDIDWQTEIFTDQTHTSKLWKTWCVSDKRKKSSSSNNGSHRSLTRPSLNQAANQHTHRDKKMNKCCKYGRMGHWARDCRSNYYTSNQLTIPQFPALPPSLPHTIRPIWKSKVPNLVLVRKTV